MNGVSAAEKYAELREQGLAIPLCKCHEQNMLWEKRPTRKGGVWRCYVRALHNGRRYESSPQGREIRRLRNQRSNPRRLRVGGVYAGKI